MKKYCIITHTHWDREWYSPYEVFRLRLVDLIDSVLKCIEKEPSYIFHMDAQTIVLEDYLAIRPDKKELLQRYIESGNIIIGPWYVQNDFYLSSGEATVRNLLTGIKISRSYGENSFVGYTPDQFGLPSQLPQILCGFDIHDHIFGRGDLEYDLETMNIIPHPSEAYWEAPNGSRVFSVFMPTWYNNLQRLPDDIDKATEKIENAALKLDKWKASPYYLMMNGVDHLEPQDNLFEILEKVNQKLVDATAVQMSMKEYLSLAKPYMSDAVRKGELRKGADFSVLPGTFSTRTDIKKMNFEIQQKITDAVEPLYSMLYMLGAKDIYPQQTLEYALKLLMQNHAHDSICCCSHNNVMRHMKDKFTSVGEITDELIHRGIRFLNHHIQRESDNDGKYYLTLANTTQSDYTGVLKVFIDIAKKQNADSFEIFNASGEKVFFNIISHHVAHKECMSPLNSPGTIEVDRFITEIYVENLKGFSYENLVIVSCKAHIAHEKMPLLENEYLKIEFADKKINIIDKAANTIYEDAVYFDDIGDCGCSYFFIPVENDSPIRFEAKDIQTVSHTPLSSSVKVVYEAEIPFTSQKEARSAEKKRVALECTISLAKGERHLKFDIEIDNSCEYHLIRGIVNPGINSDITYASSVFDIIERDRRKIIPKITDGTQPVNEFVYIKDETKKMAVYTMGLYEYKHTSDGKIALSLLRSTGRINFTHFADSGNWDASENVMFGKTRLNFAIMPYTGSDEIVPTYAKSVTVKPVYYCDSTNRKLFLAGETMIPGAAPIDIYEKKDKYDELNLPHTMKLLDMNSSLYVSAFKKAEADEDLILRIYNPWENKQKQAFDGLKIAKTNLLEEKTEDYSEFIEKKEIATFKIKCSNKI